jgi:tRNA uridine 5-carboxymethylaminomethyl modification enzyme
VQLETLLFLIFISKTRLLTMYDVIVIGGGHAGIEAALASARMGVRTLMITILVEQIGASSCNPAIGGLAKGHLVKEIDALGGEMGKATDATGLQFRLLNSSKGPAVRGSRAQIDMDRYRIYMRGVVLNTPYLDVIQETATGLKIEDGTVTGVTTQLGNLYTAKKIIIAAGTFLGGLIHIGEQKQQAGRQGEFASIELADYLRSLGLEIGRLKTGTCARIAGDSIDFSVMEIQGGDKEPIPFSFRTDRQTFDPDQMPCHVTYTNERTHEIIESNFYRAPLFSGQIEGVGPRYCPSIEDKIDRFRDRPRHQIFVEPQTREATEYYLNGLSTSLPPDVQQDMIHSVPGLENARIVRYGYAIEYDFIQPTELTHTLETKKIPGLYWAGQVNGTTGYEEAGAQGMIAGINAALSIQGKEPFVLGRDEAYIGVLIDDLVTKGTQEPYRMFTSRAEYRLLLREDNADIRLGHFGKELGLLDESTAQTIETKKQAISRALNFLKTSYATPTKEFLSQLNATGIDKINDKTAWIDIIGRGDLSQEQLLSMLPEFGKYDGEVLDQVLVEAKYNRYIEKQQSQIDRMHDMLKIKIPAQFDYTKVQGLSNEIVEKLQHATPPTLQSASQISGITPAALEILHVYIKMTSRR